MEFSAFTGFGHLEFSSERPVGERIYENLRAAMGGDIALGEDSFEGPMAGKLFATAMALANVQRSIDHVNQESRPGLSDELLEVHETDYQVTPPVGATKDERRAVLAAKVQVAEGCPSTVVDAALSDLLGSHLIAVRRYNENDYTVYPADWDTTGPGLWKDAERATIAKTHRLSADVAIGTSTITVEELSGDAFVGGETAIIDAGEYGIEESVTILSDGAGNLSAVFAHGHEAGALMTTSDYPRAASTARHLLIVTDSTVARSRAWRVKIADLLELMLRAIDSWSVVEEYTTGQLGPFIPGEGIPGITPLVETTTAEAA